MNGQTFFFLEHVADDERACAVVLLPDLRLRLDEFNANSLSIRVEVPPSERGLGPDMLDHLIALGFLRLDEVQGAVQGFCAGVPIEELSNGARNVTMLLRSLGHAVANARLLHSDA